MNYKQNIIKSNRAKETKKEITANGENEPHEKTALKMGQKCVGIYIYILTYNKSI